MVLVAQPAPANLLPGGHRSSGPLSDLASSAESHWVEAAPFRAWIRQLVSDTGLPWRVLARAASVPSGTVQTLLRGQAGRPVQQMRRLDADRLLRLDHRRLHCLASEPASCESLRLLTWSLGLAGFSPDQIGSFIGCDTRSVRVLMAGGSVWCSRLQQLRAEAACEAWGRDPDEVLRAGAGVARRSA